MKITRRQLKRIIKEELSRQNESITLVNPKGDIHGKDWGFVGTKIEKLGKKKSDYNFYIADSSVGLRHVAVPINIELPKMSNAKSANPTNDELNRRYNAVTGYSDSDYFKD